MVQATETFTGDLDEAPFVVRAGETYTEDNPIVQNHGQFFGPVKADATFSAPLDPEKVVF